MVHQQFQEISGMCFDLYLKKQGGVLIIVYIDGIPHRPGLQWAVDFKQQTTGYQMGTREMNQILGRHYSTGADQRTSPWVGTSLFFMGKAKIQWTWRVLVLKHSCHRGLTLCKWFILSTLIYTDVRRHYFALLRRVPYLIDLNKLPFKLAGVSCHMHIEVFFVLSLGETTTEKS